MGESLWIRQEPQALFMGHFGSHSPPQQNFGEFHGDVVIWPGNSLLMMLFSCFLLKRSRRKRRLGALSCWQEVGVHTFPPGITKNTPGPTMGTTRTPARGRAGHQEPVSLDLNPQSKTQNLGQSRGEEEGTPTSCTAGQRERPRSPPAHRGVDRQHSGRQAADCRRVHPRDL